MKEEREERGRKIIRRNNDWKLSKFGEKHQHQGTSRNSKIKIGDSNPRSKS